MGMAHAGQSRGLAKPGPSSVGLAPLFATFLMLGLVWGIHLLRVAMSDVEGRADQAVTG